MRLEKHPSKILRKKCRYLGDLSKKRKDRINKMLKQLQVFGGIGLAAPQVGWNARVFVMNVTQKPEDNLVFINPEIVEYNGDMVDYPEGCLSFPGLVGLVERPQGVTVKAIDIDGEEFTFIDDALAARCAMHEIDHLDGILLIDVAKKLYEAPKS